MAMRAGHGPGDLIGISGLAFILPTLTGFSLGNGHSVLYPFWLFPVNRFIFAKGESAT